MKRGDIFYIEIPYATGHEMEKDRPGIVVSATAANVMRDVVQVVFCSASTQHQMPEHVEIHSTPRRSTAMCEHIYTVDKSRVGTYIGTATPEEMEQLEAALSKALALGAKNAGGGGTPPLHRRKRAACRKRMSASAASWRPTKPCTSGY